MSGRKKPGGKSPSAKKKKKNEKHKLRTYAGTSADQSRSPTAIEHEEYDRNTTDDSSKTDRRSFASSDTSFDPLHNPTSSEESTFQLPSNKDRDSERIGAENTSQTLATSYNGGSKPYGTLEGADQDVAHYTNDGKARGTENVDIKRQETHTAAYPKTSYDGKSRGAENVDIQWQGTQTAVYPQTAQTISTSNNWGSKPYGTHEGADPYDTQYTNDGKTRGAENFDMKWQGTQTAAYPKTKNDGKTRGAENVDMEWQGTQTAAYPKAAYDGKSRGAENVDIQWQGTQTAVYPQTANDGKTRGAENFDMQWQGTQTSAYPKTKNDGKTRGAENVDIEWQGTQTAAYPKTEAIESSSRADNIEYINVEWSRKGKHTFQDRTEVPWVTKEFVLYCRETIVDGSVRIKLLDNDIIMRKSTSSEYIYKRKVAIPSDFPEGIQYWYEIKQPGTHYSTQLVKSKHYFRYDSRHIYRDCWEYVSADLISSHIVDIIDSNIGIAEANLQIATLPYTRLGHKQKEKLFSSLSYYINQQDRNRKNISVAICVFLTFDENVDLKKILSKETARALLEDLEKLKLCDLSSPFHKTMPRLYSQLCNSCFDVNTVNIAELYFSFPFLGEEQLYDKLLSMHYLSNSTVNEQNKKFAVGLLTKLHRSPSFGDQTSLKVIRRILTSLPFDLAMTAFASLVGKKSESQSHETLKETVQEELIKRIEKKIKVLEEDKLEKFHSLWKKVRAVAESCEPFKQIFENCLVDLTKTPYLTNVQIIVQIAKESALFATAERKVDLLNAVVRSPDYQVAELFMTLAQVHGYVDIYQTIDSNCFELWYYNSRNTKNSSVKQNMNVVCQRLGRIVSLKKVSHRQEIVDIVNRILCEELKKRTLEHVVEIAKEFEDATKESILLTIFVEHISKEIRHTTIDLEKLVGPFLVKGLLQLQTKFIADILHAIIDKYGNTGGESSLKEQFFKVVEQRRLWTVVFKSEGRYKEIITGHPFYISTSTCVRMIAEKLSKLEIDYKFMKRIDAIRNDVIDTLSSFLKREKINGLIDRNQKTLNGVESRIKAVTSVLRSIKVQSIKLPDQFSEFTKKINEKVADFYEGKLEGNDSYLLWETMDQIPEYCLELDTVVKSVVYWNLLRDELTNETLENESKTEDTSSPKERDTSEPEKESYSELDDENEDQDVEKDRSNFLTWNKSIQYIEQMCSVGIKCYRQHMQHFFEENDLSMSKVLSMFNCKTVVNPTGKQKPDLDMEKTVAESVIGIPCVNSTWDVLGQIYSVAEIKSKVEGMQSFLQVIQIHLESDLEFTSALESFEQLLGDDVNEYSFIQVKSALGMIYSIINTLSDSTFDIMTSIGQCSSLFGFLKETADEDIRNLIDAVEDISEQQVGESTVSGLIEIKQMLLPFLKPKPAETCQQLLNCLEVQVERISRSTKIPAKIHDCMENLHNLKSLYNNVANRGEQTRQIVKNIIDHGTFKFHLDENAEIVLLESRYKQHESLVTKKREELIDLRSRSLLLMNTDNKTTGSSQLSREQVGMFVGYVDQCLDLSDLCSLLHTSGHFKYITIDKELGPTALVAEKEKLTEEFSVWEKELFDERNRHYLMNYIHGFGLHAMHLYLNMYEHVSAKDREKLQHTVQTILLFIHPNMRADLLREKYFAEKRKCNTWSSANWLHCLGEALHGFYPVSTLSPDRNIVRQKGESLKITDVVQEGKLFLAQLGEKSVNTVRTVIALYANTGNRMPESHQVLFCTRETSLDEIDLLIERCLGAKKFYGIMPLYCIANVELLPSELYSDFLDILWSIPEEDGHFRLALVCRGTDSHQIIDKLSKYKTTIAPASDSFVKSIFKAQHGNVVTLTSELAGVGKSSRVIKSAHMKRKAVAILHVSGSSRKAHLIQRLNSLQVRPFHVLHIDIGTVDDPKELDTFLFELLILGYVSVGRISVALVTEHVYLEIANTINETLRNSLQTAMLFSREHITWQKFNDFIVSKEIQSPVQVVCKYLSFLEKGYLDKKDISFEESRPKSSKTCRRLLKKYIGTTDDMTFPVVSASLDVLADQFKKMTCSPFFRISRLKDMTGDKAEKTVKTSLIKAMITSTIEFASRSVGSCRATQSSTIQSDEDHAMTDTIDIASRVTQRIKGMIRWEDSNHLMFVFHCQNIQTLSPLYRDRLKVPDNIKDLFCRQMNKELKDFKSLSQTQLQGLLQKIARNSPIPLPDSKLRDIASGYALTPDNLLKMVLIMLRVKANVPVVVMGETGCGKTSLVRYLASICEVPFKVLNIHAGVTEKMIISFVCENSSEASKSLNSERWLFLDEINTSESIGIISEIICHHKCLGNTLPPNLVVMGACNPYKLRSKKDIATAGLTLQSENDQLSRLVYRVLPLPEMMVDYVWDFGSLNDNDENLYIKRMVDGLFPSEKFNSLFSDMLSASQSFVRQKEESTCVVSLRDVNRCRLLTEWFKHVLCNKTPCKKYTFNCETNIRAMLLALSHCYHNCFPSKDMRADYRKILQAKLNEYGIEVFRTSQDKIGDLIKEEQRDFISRMELPDGTACNTALMENVFVIIVCIYNRLPVFVVGKPGCSKSLAMQIIRSNLRGKDSKDIFFKTLPQLYCVSFQGSESSTSDGIVKVFAKAEKYQSSNSADDVLSVVILDEIGLAEVSRFNPLKVLHNLLEPDGEMIPRVAVVGLSNWSLDASKMNRAIHLSRTDMDVEELYETAKAISESFASNREKKPSSKRDTFMDAIERPDETEQDDLVIDMTDKLKGISKSYHDYILKLRIKNFHGLRDYYALVKYVARTWTSKTRYTASIQQTKDDILNVSRVVQSGLERNFGGLPSESRTLYEIFIQYFNFNTHVRRNVLDLIAENVEDQIARHLMLITSGDSSLGILEEQLNRIGRSTKEVIFGSQFEDDLTDDYNYRILSRIILCMEEGMILILKDLENIYGSLYDMLNQNYTIIGNKKNCRIALGAYSNPICQVGNSFRCIVLMDESKVKSCDPPFLNRFEKQYLRFSDVLSSEQRRLVNHLKTWIESLRDIHERSFDYTDVFPIYSEDLLPSLVLKTERECEQADISGNRFSYLSKMCKLKLLWILKPEAVVRLKRATCSSTAVEADEIKRAFFDLPLHRGLEDLISSQLSNLGSMPEEEGILTIVFTNSNMHISLPQCISYTNVQIEKLSTFKSEKQVSTKIQNFWSQDTKADILFVQCSAVDDEKHIVLTKAIIERHRTAYQSVSSLNKKHVYLIIHTPANKGLSKIVFQINFMSDWNLVMLDSIEPPKTDLQQLCKMDILEAVQNKRPLNKCLIKLLFWSFTRIKYSPLGRNLNSIKDILTKIKSSPDFLHFLDKEIWRTISEMEIQEKDWQTKVACDIQALRNSSSFADALEQYIMKIIKDPLTKLIFCMEQAGILDSYFINDSVSNERKKAWLNLIHNDEIFSLGKIPDETGPECYSCETSDCSLKMPFSRILFSRLESQKEQFINGMSDIKANKGYRDVENQKVLQREYNDLLVKQEKLAMISIPDWHQFCYDTCEKDYIHDFSSMLAVNICSGMSREKRAYNMEWVVLQKTDLSEKRMLATIIRLHATAWMNMSLFRSEMLLLATCEKVGLDKQVLVNMMRFNGLHSKRESTITMEEGNNDNEPDIIVGGNGNEFLKYDCKEYMFIDSLDDNEINSEQAEEVEISLEINKMKAEDYLVEDLCREMIPTKEIIECYGGIDAWQRTVNAILAHATKVSVEGNLIYALRVCNEIAGNLIIPVRLDKNYLFELGDILHSGSIELDSKEVFDKIVEIISVSLKTDSFYQTECYRVFSSYLVRCITINAETEVLDFYFLSYFLESKIPDKMIHHFRAPLYLILDLETSEVEGNKLQYFLFEDVGDFEIGSKEKEENFDTVSDKSEDSSMDSEAEQGRVVYTFDKFLKTLAARNRLDEPIVLLIVDLLTDIFESSLRKDVFGNKSSDRFRPVYDCHKIILDRTYGIRFISAIAYVRSFISLLGEQQMWDYDSTRDYWNAVNDLLSDLKLNEVSSTLLAHFIKCISKGLTVLQLKMNIGNKKDKHDFLEQIVWSNGSLHFCFDGKPFCLLLDETAHSKLHLCSGIQEPSKVEDSLMAFASGKYNNEHALQMVLSFISNEYQLTKGISETKDAATLLLLRFTKKIAENKYRWLRVLKFVSGTEDFLCKGFDLETESKHLNYNAQRFLLQLFILLLSHNEYEEDHESSVFIRCLTSPLSVKEWFLPGFVDSPADSNTMIDHPIGLATCNCGSRIAIHFNDAINDMECVFCSESLKYENVSRKEMEKEVEKLITVWRFDDIPKGQFTVRGLHPVTFQLLQLILKGCILGSIAFGYASTEDVMEIVGDAFEVSHLFEDISKHWKQLSNMLNLDDYAMSTLLRVIVLETSESFCKLHIVHWTETRRSDWERMFEVKLKGVLVDRFNIVKTKLHQHNTLHGVKDSSFENILSETNDITHMSETQRQSILPLLFRIKSTPTRENFISEYMWRKPEFPFLDLILQFEDQLSMPKHLYSIIQWHITTVASVSYRLKKHECLEMTVQDLYRLTSNKKELLKTRFEAFKKAWNEMPAFFHKADIGLEIKDVHEGTKLKECLLYNKDTVVFKVLEQLVQIQNHFLNRTLMIADRSDALHFLSVNERVFVFPCVQVTEIRMEDLIDFDFTNDSWAKTLRKESLCRLEYGCGGETVYDFHNIEKMFAMKVLPGKSYIDFRHNLPNIIFADERYVNYADLLQEIKARIKQKPLTDEIKESIQAKKNDNPKLVMDLLSHLGILMTLLKKTGGDAEAPLVDYVSIWSNVLSHEFPKDLLPETSVKLCHIIGLNELLEEICSETVLDALEKEYTENLDDVANTHIIKLLRDTQVTKVLLQALKRFVYRGVFTQTADADMPLCDYLTEQSFWPESCSRENGLIKIGGKEESIKTLLPDYLMVRHVQSLIKQVEREMEKKEKESVHMDKVPGDFNQQRDRRTPKQKARAKRERAKRFREY